VCGVYVWLCVCGVCVVVCVVVCVWLSVYGVCVWLCVCVVCGCVCVLTHVVSESESGSVVSDSAATWTIQSMEFSRPEYWRG